MNSSRRSPAAQKPLSVPERGMAALLVGIAAIGLVLFGVSHLLTDEKSQASSAAAPVEASVEAPSAERRHPVAQRPSVRWVPAGNAVAPAPVAPQAVSDAAQEYVPAVPQVYYPNCTAVWDAGLANIPLGQPGYREALDGDNDDVACEQD